MVCVLSSWAILPWLLSDSSVSFYSTFSVLLWLEYLLLCQVLIRLWLNNIEVMDLPMLNYRNHYKVHGFRGTHYRSRLPHVLHFSIFIQHNVHREQDGVQCKKMCLWFLNGVLVLDSKKHVERVSGEEMMLACMTTIKYFLAVVFNL